MTSCPRKELACCDVNTTSLNKKSMTIDMYRFKKEKETVKMEDTEEGNMKYKTHDTHYNNNNKEKKAAHIGAR